MYFELLRTDTFNVVGDFASMDEALLFVRRAADEQGDRSVEVLTLAREQHGNLIEVAAGATLLALARQQPPEVLPEATG